MLEQESEAMEQQASKDFQNSQQTEYHRLRSLMLGEDYEKILKNRLDKQNIERVSEVLTEAFRKRNSQDDTLAKEMSPVIESAIDASIKEHPERITNVIFPIIGPAVRKAVSSALADLMQSLNYLLQNSLSVRAIVWRFKAWRLGMPYEKYILLQSIQYQVEQVFLIHRETGLLIQSVQADGVNYQDPDLVSSMLTAISDFAKDSFDQQTDKLETLQLGDLTVFIETGPHAVLAFAIRGTLNNEVKQISSHLIEKIHAKFNKELRYFNGDTTTFNHCVEYLKEALVRGGGDKIVSKPWYAILAVIVLSGFIGFYFYKDIQLDYMIKNTIELVNQQKGYRVLTHHFSQNTITIDVLKSPLAINEAELLSKLPSKNIQIKLNQKLASIGNLELYLPYLVYKYKIELSIVPDSDKPKLIASGEVTKDSLVALANDPLVLNYFVLQESPLMTFKVNLSMQQIQQNEFIQLVQLINSHYFYYEIASDTLTFDSQTRLKQAIIQLKQLISLQQGSGIKIIQIGIDGFADAQGSRVLNMALSQNRARIIKSILQENEIENQLIVSWGRGSKDLDSVPSKQQRRARIEVLYLVEGTTNYD